ncbi:MAG: hypothetical protein R3305_00815 [Gammaproteobacteria bacterium]|nr:hypothetical protein [Gammaproteobacteria bacterium]
MTGRAGLRRLWPLVLAMFSLRAIVPAGFMPAPIGQGAPFAVCHGGAIGIAVLFGSARANVHGTLHEADHEHGHEPASSHAHLGAAANSLADDDVPVPLADSHDDRWSKCPVGVTAGDLFDAAGVVLALREGSFERTPPGATSSIRAADPHRYFARAPPA